MGWKTRIGDIDCITLSELNKLLEDGLQPCIITPASNYNCRRIIGKGEVECGKFYGLVIHPRSNPLYVISIPCV